VGKRKSKFKEHDSFRTSDKDIFYIELFFFHLFSLVIYCVIFLTCNLVGMIVPKVFFKVEY